MPLARPSAAVSSMQRHLLLTFSTGTQVLLPQLDIATDHKGRLHTFCSVLEPGATCPGWYTMGATLTAGMALTWLSEQILNLSPSAETAAMLVAEAEGVPPGSRGLIFLPYLIGERAPAHGPPSRGASTSDSQPLTAAPSWCAPRSKGSRSPPTMPFSPCDRSAASRSESIWQGAVPASNPGRQAVADTFGLPVVALVGEDHTAIGAAILAGAAIGLHDPVARALAWRIESKTTAPIDGNQALYQDLFGIFQRAYQALRSDMRYLAALADKGMTHISPAARAVSPGRRLRAISMATVLNLQSMFASASATSRPRSLSAESILRSSSASQASWVPSNPPRGQDSPVFAPVRGFLYWCVAPRISGGPDSG